MANILFVVRGFSSAGAQPLRFRKLISFLKKTHNIVVVEYTDKDEIIKEEENLVIIRLKYSKLGKFFNRRQKGVSENNFQNGNKQVSKVLYIFRFLKTLVFPDPFITEILGLKSQLRKLIIEYKIDLIVGSAFPHSTLMLSTVAKKANLPFIYDIGDPFFGNANNLYLKNFFARYYEKRYLKKISRLVVTNIQTQKFYETNYPFLVSKIDIVEQGIDPPKTKGETKVSLLNENKHFKLLYAGQFYSKLREPFELYKAINEINTNLNGNSYLLSIFGNISNIFTPTNLEFISLNGYASNEEIWDHIEKSDIVVFIDNSFGIQTPGKVFEVIASRKPILFIGDNLNSPAYTIAKTYPNVFYCSNKKEDIKTTINLIVSTSHSSYELKNIEKFYWENRANDFNEIILRTLKD